MNIYIDTEFTGLHQCTTLISLGIITEDNQGFYAEFTNYDKSQLNPWLEENVISNLLMSNNKQCNLEDFELSSLHMSLGDTDLICKELSEWLSAVYVSVKEPLCPVLDVGQYDMVLFNQIFGHAYKVPGYINYIPFDVATLFKVKGINPDIVRETFVDIDSANKKYKHNALWDAYVTKKCWEKAWL